MSKVAPRVAAGEVETKEWGAFFCDRGNQNPRPNQQVLSIQYIMGLLSTFYRWNPYAEELAYERRG